MEPRQLAQIIADILADKKAEDITILDVERIVSYTSFVVLATARSERQVRAITDHIERILKERKVARPLGTEGLEAGGWALVDFGDVVVHVFRPDERYLYDLEGLWAEATRIDYIPSPTT